MRRRKGGHPAFVAAAVLLLISVALMAAPDAVVRPAHTAVLAVTAPFERALGGALDALTGFPDRFRSSDRLLDQCRALTEQNTELSSRVDYLRTQVLDRDKLIAQIADLRRVLPAKGYDVLPAQIVAKTPAPALSPGAVTFTLGLGSEAGVRRDDLVVTGYAVVGRVISVAPGACQVQAITAPEFRIAARTSPDGVEALLRGGPGAACQLAYVDSKAAIKPGDYVVTSGFEGRHPANLLLGVVEKVQPAKTGRSVTVVLKPAANFAVLSQVIIVRKTAGK